MMVKIQKRTINSSEIHTPLAQGFGLDGDVDGVDGKTSPAREEATKVRPIILQHFKFIHLTNGCNQLKAKKSFLIKA